MSWCVPSAINLLHLQQSQNMKKSYLQDISAPACHVSKIFLMSNRGRHNRCVFRTLSNIDDRAFLRKQLMVESCQLFSQKTPSYMFNKVLQTPLFRGVTKKYFKVRSSFLCVNCPKVYKCRSSRSKLNKKLLSWKSMKQLCY